MHQIEKELLIERLYVQTWQLYQNSILQGSILKAMIELPLLEVVCKGIDNAGYWRSPFHGLPATIMINSAYYNGEHTSSLEETIAHELAHHISHYLYPKAKQWHGKDFRFVMNAVGYDGNTYHSMSTAKAKVVALKAKDELFDL